MQKHKKRALRLDQLLSHQGFGSRKDAQQMISAGRVKVEGEEVFEAEMRVDPYQVQVDGQALEHPEGLLLMLHKPVGYVCSHEDGEGGPSVYTLLPEQWRRRTPQIVSVGRLDKDTSGLLLLTDQHELVHRLTSPKKHVPKVYELEFEGELGATEVELFASGTLQLRGEAKPCLPAELRLMGARKARVQIVEGRYHQVRRMVAAVGAHVTQLQRVQIGSLNLGELEIGKYRCLPLDTSF